MKIVCEACQAKYRIPDERVAGKKLKIRCRRCGGGIIILGDAPQPQAVGAVVNPTAVPRGATLPPPPEVMRASRPPSVPLDEWYVSVSGVERGPMTTGEVVDELSAGTLQWEAHVWREGFAEWVTARECQNLVSQAERSSFSSPPSPPSKPPVHDDDAPTAMFDAEKLAAQDSATNFVPRGSRSSSVPPLAAMPPAVSRIAPQSLQSPLPSARLSSAPRASSSPAATGPSLTGARNDDSVLFSAATMRDLSATTPPPQLESGTHPAGDGYATGEGSGLIDIRQLASLAKSTSSAPPTGVSLGGASQPSDELMSLANQPGAFGAIDSLAPVTSSGGSSSKAVPLAILGGSIMVAAAAFAAIMITRAGPVPAPAAAAAAQPTTVEPVTALAPAPELAVAPETEVEEAPDTEAEADPTAADEDTEAASDDGVAAAAPTPAAVATKRKAKFKAKRKPGMFRPKKKAAKVAATSLEESDKGASIDDLLSGKSSASSKPEPDQAPVETAAVEPAAADAEPKKTADLERDRSIDELLSGAVDKNAAATPALAAQPSRDEVLKAMRGVQGAVQKCGTQAGVSGKALVAITVAGTSGRVSGVQVTGITGDAGSCIARAVRSAKFSKFSKPNFSVKFPFKLR